MTNGFNSRRDSVKSLGDNPDEVDNAVNKRRAAFDKDGIKPACDAGYDTNRVAEKQNGDKENNEDE